MNAPGIDEMGMVKVTCKLTNNVDAHLAAAGVIPPDSVRSVQVEGLVDTGAVRLVLPADVVAALGVPQSGETRVRYADDRTATRPTVSDVLLELEGRKGSFSAIVEPNRKTALIGAIVMEDLDLLVDCSNQVVQPRDPEIVTSTIGW